MATQASSRQFKLAKESELRVEVGGDSPLRVRLLSGTAEIFGTELPPENWISVPPRLKFAVCSFSPLFSSHSPPPFKLIVSGVSAGMPQIFTWHGATIEVDGISEVEYVADETPMVSYVNVHAILDGRRARAKASPSSDLVASQGPRVIVVGPTDSGKSSLCRMLLSWACKRGWKPMFVDLDIGQGSITLPGCIASTPIEMPIDAVEGIPLEMPIVYFYGHTTPSINGELYKVLAKELAQTLERHFSANAESRAAGMVINTMGWVEGLGYELLLHAIDTFNANVVLVLGQEYFYGLSNDLSPHSNIVSFSDITVYRIGGGPQAPRSALPIGAEPVADPTRLVAVNISRDLLHLILAVSYAKEPDQIISSNVAGFIYVTDIDIQRKKLTYLAPCPGELPSRLLIVGTLTWMES